MENLKFKDQSFKTLSKLAGKCKRRITTVWLRNGESLEIKNFLFPNQIKRQVPDCHRFIYEYGSGVGTGMSYPFRFNDLGGVTELK